MLFATNISELSLKTIVNPSASSSFLMNSETSIAEDCADSKEDATNDCYKVDKYNFIIGFIV